MRKCFTKIILAGILMSSYSTAFAGNRVALSCVGNKTGKNINFQFKWGNGAWQPGMSYPGQIFATWHTYAHIDENSSPTLLIRFDSTFSPDQFQITRKLRKFSSPNANCNGRSFDHFNFDAPPSQNTIDIFKS